mmetsp:Transcript_52309/g.126498  ORF Transcript_52309/g.126498 Transcript_52309/m.126498 type:complete len:716 (+) Transcript_52309:23-2170(+)
MVILPHTGAQPTRSAKIQARSPLRLQQPRRNLHKKYHCHPRQPRRHRLPCRLKWYYCRKITGGHHHNNRTSPNLEPASSPSSSTTSFVDWALDQFRCTGRFDCTIDGGDETRYRSSSSFFDCYNSNDVVGNDDSASVSESVLYGTRGSLYRRTMMTAATANANVEGKDTAASSTAAATTSGGSTTPTHSSTPQQQFQKSLGMARGLADDASRAIGNLLPTASLQSITTRKYTLPDKTVASQVLMYRQLLHTKCRPGLKLSRPYQETEAQQKVKHMPWWSEGIEETKKMVISYDNLITRLWLNGAIEPFRFHPTAKTAHSSSKVDEKPAPTLEPLIDLLGGTDTTADSGTTPPEGVVAGESTKDELETFVNEEGLPPVPHEYWVERLGFQQPDPVTDFRSGGVLSLAMMVYMVESKPVICQRFFTGDTAVLPFGITCINVTDMIAKFLMLAKSTDRMDALLSQKPFWKMFGDPNAILAVQEIAMSMLCDVAAEIGQEKKVPALAEKYSDGMPGYASDKVTVFDFSTILELTEKRVRDDLLGAGPKTVDELRSIAARLRLKYQNQLDRKIQRAKQQEENQKTAPTDDTRGVSSPVTSKAAAVMAPPPQLKGAMDKAGSMASGLFSKMKSTSFSTSFSKTTPQTQNEPSATIVDLPAEGQPAAISNPTSTSSSSDVKAAPTSGSTDGDWTGTDIAPATDAISNFSIGDDDEDEPDLLL